jgi:hypothetical protein
VCALRVFLLLAQNGNHVYRLVVDGFGVGVLTQQEFNLAVRVFDHVSEVDIPLVVLLQDLELPPEVVALYFDALCCPGLLHDLLRQLVQLVYQAQLLDTFVDEVARAAARTAQPLGVRVLLHLADDLLRQLNQRMHLVNHVLVGLLQVLGNLALLVRDLLDCGVGERVARAEFLMQVRDFLQEFLRLGQVTARSIVINDLTLLHLFRN